MGNYYVPFYNVAVRIERCMGLFIGNGNGTPYIESCALFSYGLEQLSCSITNIMEADLTIETQDYNQSTCTVIINNVHSWGFYSLLVFDPDR